MVFPPQGISGGVVDADAVEDDYIAKFRSLDPKVVRLFTSAEFMVNVGLLTVDDVAKYVDANVNALPASAVALYCNNVFSVSFSASLLGNANMSASRAAQILNDDNISFSKVVQILNDNNMSASKAAQILSDNNISFSKVVQILSDSNMPADKTQSILYSMTFSTRLVDIITYDAGDLTVLSDMSINGVNRYRTLTVNSNVTLTITGQPGVLIVNTLNNEGTIAKSATGGAGGAPGASGAGHGGDGGGGLVIFAASFQNSGIISADGANGQPGTSVSASGIGVGGESGIFIRVETDGAGTGGYGGNYYRVDYNPGGVNGGGGGGTASYPGGAGDGSSYITFNDYASMAEEIKYSVIDWFIVNVIGKTPTTTKSIINVYGSGGGGGGASDRYNAGGGGGGGGGEILVLCVSLNNTGTICANGGNGGDGGDEGVDDACGGGGGGGIIYVLYNNLINIGTLSVAGGVHGATADFHGANGTAGTAKAVAVSGI
jgi:hypothetical protein